ncbi:MAG: FAD-dependent oxidoreductase, partial [Eubacteriales bacterium]
MMNSNKVGAVMVVGAGIAGIQASLDLAESGYLVYLVEKSPAIGGTMPMLDKTFPTNDCSMCILSPKLVECGRHLNIRTLTCAEVMDLQGEPGNFKVTVKKKARFVHVDKCKGCGDCAEACPEEVDDEFNQGLGPRKVIYKPYAQAFPNAYVIDKERCLECGSCEDACQAGAIDHNMEDETIEIEVGSVIFCPGFEVFNAGALDYYGYGKYKNVITSLEFERILSASGPFQGHMVRPSDHKEPKKVAWIQCVGSRNIKQEKGYCSAVCCMYAIKEAMIAKEHSSGDFAASIFYMDMRTYGKGFEKYYERAKEGGVSFIRSRIFAIEEKDDGSGNLFIRYADENGQIHYEEFDVVVLSVGLKPSDGVVETAGRLGLELNNYKFCEPAELSGVGTNKPGIYVAGAFSAPKDIPETVMQASAAAGESARLLAEARGTLVTEKEFPAENNVSGEEPRIGVFVCHCGVNIGSVVKVPEVVEMAKTLPNVVYAGEYLYVCSQDAQNTMKELISEHKLNRVVVASCSPRTHKPLFQETMRDASLNPYLFEMANIRDQCSWVHQQEPDKATAKAKDLVKMVVAKAALLEQVTQSSSSVVKEVLVIGGGVAGMTSALSLADLGYQVHLVEKEGEPGGVARRIDHGLKGEDVKTFLSETIVKVKGHPKVKLHTGAEVKEVSGFVGNFKTVLDSGEQLNHGVTVIATGGEEYKPSEYLYGQNGNVMTQLELGEAIAAGDPKVKGAKNVVLIQCVGSREPGRLYCSRVCCTKSIKLALDLKEMNPEMNVFILYRDIRSYGFYEDLYREARSKGIIFV